MLSSSSILPSPLPPAPRLIASESDWLRLRRQVQTDPLSAKIYADISSAALELLETIPLERVMTGYRLLMVSRGVLLRVAYLAVTYQITSDHRFAKRAIAEMLSAASFTDWNPNHFLDTAEMTLALGLCYDWLNAELTAEEKTICATAVLEKGLIPSLDEPERWFVRGNNNWNQVCHAGLSAGAIAVADRYPEVVEKILRRSIDNLHYSAHAYEPDGAYAEGPIYWDYGTCFQVILASALQRLTGNTQGVDQYPGFVESAEYINQVTTPAGRFYAYADGNRIRPVLTPLFWFAREQNRPDWLRLEGDGLGKQPPPESTDIYNRLLPLALLWHDPEKFTGRPASSPQHWMGKGTMPVAIHRSGSLFVGIKGGSPSLNHAHMDVGSFVIEADGVTWAADLGAQSYESLELSNVNLWDASENGMRWNIFRFGPESHNIIRFNGPRQDLPGSAHFVQFSAEEPRPHSVLDLTPLYQTRVESAERGVMLLDGRAILLQDEWRAAGEEMEVTWQMLVPAQVNITGHKIELMKEGKTFTLYLLDHPDATITCQGAAELLQPYDAPNPGLHRLTIKVKTAPAQNGTLRLLGVPSQIQVDPPVFLPLRDWSPRFA